MAIFEYLKDKFVPLSETTFESEHILERQDLQRRIAEAPDILMPELFILAESFSSWEDSGREIDLLGLTRDARLVVVELKRDDRGAHAELQAVRYAALVSPMTFEQATIAHAEYLQTKNIKLDAKTEILKFLGWSEPRKDDFASDVLIILAAAGFSNELISTVFWLNERGLEIRCIRLRPYKLGDKLLVNAEQLVPLPEAGDYQIRLQEQREQRREAQRSSRDLSKFKFNGENHGKGRLVLAVVKAFVLKSSPQNYAELKKAFPDKLQGSWGVVSSYDEITHHTATSAKECYFMQEDEVLALPSNELVAVSNQWGKNFDAFLLYARGMGFQIEKVI